MRRRHSCRRLRRQLRLGGGSRPRRCRKAANQLIALGGLNPVPPSSGSLSCRGWIREWLVTGCDGFSVRMGWVWRLLLGHIISRGEV